MTNTNEVMMNQDKTGISQKGTSNYTGTQSFKITLSYSLAYEQYVFIEFDWFVQNQEWPNLSTNDLNLNKG